MSQSRKDLIAQYDIQEPGLQELFNDLFSKTEDDENIAIINNALFGVYSNYGSPLACPQLTLSKHLKNAGYDEMAQKALDGEYDYNYAPKKGASSYTPKQKTSRSDGASPEFNFTRFLMQRIKEHKEATKNADEASSIRPSK